MIVVTTPTGQIGRQLLDRLLDGGAPVRVIARDPGRLTPRVRAQAQVIEGTHADPAVVAGAIEGAGSVFWVVPPDPGAANVEDHFMRFTRPLCEALKGGAVQRVVTVSSLGRGRAKRAGQASASLATDEAIMGTGVRFRALCMPAFMDNMLWNAETIKGDGVFYGPSSPDLKLPACATRDIAAVAAGVLLDDSWTGQEDVPVLGPEDLSQNDLAQIMTEVLERPVRFQQVSGDASKASMNRFGMSEAWAQGLVDMLAETERGLYDGASRTPDSATPTSFRKWCEGVLRPAVVG